MKRCQKCSRTFPDENQKFCTFDGGLLMADQPAFDPNRTILAPQMDSIPTPPRPPAPAPPPAPKPPVQPKPPERDLSETIVAYRPEPTPEPPSSGRQTSSDLTPPPGMGAQTSSDLVPPPGVNLEPESSDTVYAAAPTSRELPPLPMEPPPAPEPPPIQPPTPPVQPPPPPVEPAPPVQPPAPPVQPPPPPVPPPPPPVQPPPSAESAPLPPPPVPPVVSAKPAAPAPAKKKRRILPWIIAILILLLLGLAGIGVAGYIFRAQIQEFLKPYIGKKESPTPTPANGNSNTNSSNTNTNGANTNSTTNTNSAPPRPQPPAYDPPADAVQFTNAKESLDGDLADHFVAFSFYYPKTWTKDPKAGVKGATRFARVDLQLKDETGEFIKERADVSWYASNGGVAADSTVFSEQVGKLTKNLPNYEEVSKGETTLNTYKAYQVLFKGEYKAGEKSLPYWGRVIFLPPQSPNEKSGLVIVLFATSKADGVTSVEDVGTKDELKMILDSFRLAIKP